MRHIYMHMLCITRVSISKIRKFSKVSEEKYCVTFNYLSYVKKYNMNICKFFVYEWWIWNVAHKFLLNLPNNFRSFENFRISKIASATFNVRFMQNRVTYTHLYKWFYTYLLFLYTYDIDIEGYTNASFEISKIFEFSNIRKFSVETLA